MKSSFFYNKEYKKTEQSIKDFLNSKTKSELGIQESVRTTGDKIPKVIGTELPHILGAFAQSFQLPRSNRAMANYIFSDNEGFTYYVNVITHRKESSFSMPNITSVDRLKKFYSDDKNIFIILLIDYSTDKELDNVQYVRFIPIEFYSWDCLTFGALGSGQIQIKKASHIIEIIENSRKEWMIEFFDRLDEYYVLEAEKTVNRLKNLHTLRNQWKQKTDTWK